MSEILEPIFTWELSLIEKNAQKNRRQLSALKWQAFQEDTGRHKEDTVDIGGKLY